MQFHRGKCQHIRITNKKNKFESKYYIHGIGIEETESAKYLGIVIDSSLKWKEQYHEISKKANGVLALLFRNFSKCSTEIKNKCYKKINSKGVPIWRFDGFVLSDTTRPPSLYARPTGVPPYLSYQ